MGTDWRALFWETLPLGCGLLKEEIGFYSQLFSSLPLCHFIDVRGWNQPFFNSYLIFHLSSFFPGFIFFEDGKVAFVLWRRADCLKCCPFSEFLYAFPLITTQPLILLFKLQSYVLKISFHGC